MELLIIDIHNCKRSINISESTTVNQLKEEIKNQNNIKDDINLHFNGEILEDGNNLSDYDIKNGSNIIYMGEFPMNLLIIDTINNKKYINISESATVTQLKQQIKKQNNIKDDINLHFNGEILEDSQNLSDYDIENGSNIIYMGVFPAD